MEDRDGLMFLDLVIELLLGESKVISVLHTGERKDSPHLSHDYQGPPISQTMGLCDRSQSRDQVDLKLNTTRATSKAKDKAIGDVADAAPWLRWVILDLNPRFSEDLHVLI
jgi:hypothetical protein